MEERGRRGLSAWAQTKRQALCVKQRTMLARIYAKFRHVPLQTSPTTLSSVETADPYIYTAGRWLSLDKLEREARCIKFDFPALCKLAVQVCPGAVKVVSYEKKEGGFNRAFVLEMDNDTRVVARIPTRTAGPPRLATNSEVATMNYLRTKTKIPIPNILTWSDDCTNPIGTEYIVMEKVVGVRLDEKWSSMSVVEHMKCVDAVSMMVREMANLTFPAYGSLYFSNVPMDSKQKLDLGGGFCLGPHCGSVYWNCGVDEARLYGKYGRENPGPWLDLPAYCSGLIDTGFCRLPKVDMEEEEQPPYQGSPEEHIRQLKVSKEVLEKLIEFPKIKSAALPTLLHPDLHKRNIFVSENDPATVTGLIDWQSTSVEPAFVYNIQTPDFAALDDISEGFLNEDAMTSEELRMREDMSICNRTFTGLVGISVSKLRAAWALDETLLRPFRYCHISWRDSIAAVRQDFIDISNQWEQLGLPGLCPYILTEEELVKHNRQYEDFGRHQRLRWQLMSRLNCCTDGWVPVDRWEGVKKAHRRAFEEWVEEARMPDGTSVDNVTVEKARRLWPFDER